MDTTIREIARQAGVSPSTVSRALNRRGRISERTRSRVLNVARSLGYRARTEAMDAAAGPATSRSGDGSGSSTSIGGTSGSGRASIGIVFNRRLSSLVTDPFYGAVVAGIEESLQKLGYRVFLRSIDGAGDNSDLFADQAGESGFTGLLLVGCDVHPQVARTAREKGIPVVLVDNELPGEPVDCVVSDNEAATRCAIEHLYQSGHRRVGFVGGPQSHISLAQRYAGYTKALDELRMPSHRRWVVFSESVDKHGPQIGYEGTLRLMDLPQPPTAIFADNDMTALGVLKALHERGIRVPDEVSVIGFDDIQVASHTHPPLTTMHIPKQQLGSIAARRLVDIINGVDPAPVKIVIRATLVVRGTVAAPPPSDGAAAEAEVQTRVGAEPEAEVEARTGTRTAPGTAPGSANEAEA
ncbi:MAG: LacI family transcriptional regulator [Firmicutes bacterium]|nr:LacI family transcriptional regulator [Bacillota bacterium]